MRWLSVLMFPLVAFSFCFENAGSYYNVSPLLLWSIAKVESNFNTRAIHKNKNGTVDYGLMQINSSWFGYLKKHGISPKYVLEPCYNVMLGAMVLRHCINKYGNTWKAIDCYNKGDKAKANSFYIWKVYSALSKGLSQGGSGQTAKVDNTPVVGMEVLKP